MDDWSESQIPLRPRFNVAPATNLSVIVLKDGKRYLEPMRWGLSRQWDKSKPPRLIVNLRADKLARGPFKEGLIKRRCLVPADGFYEWETKQGKKRPVRFTMKDEEYFAFPAIYDEPNPEAGPPVRSFTIFTTEANSLVGRYHDRMPAILLPESWHNSEIMFASLSVARCDLRTEPKYRVRKF
jgi:putative SOS response-associated peptidase YedK